MQLSDGRVHAGTVLADNLGISRAAVWKHIQSLRKEGLPIEAVPGKGYCLEYVLDLLDADRIRGLLDINTREKTEIHILWQTTSTNDWLRQRIMQGLSCGTTCLAEQQTAGRGTRGRQWVSPPGINLYLSLYWSFGKAAAELGGLSIAVAVSLAQALSAVGYSGLMIKWPNDIYTSAGKLGGILIDMVAETNGPTCVIIGIGLNFGMVPGHQSSIDQPIDDLNWQKNRPDIDRNQLAAMIINTLTECCQTYAEKGFHPFHQQWPRWDMVQDKPVRLETENNHIDGVAGGVDEAGALIVTTGDGNRHYTSGEVSLRMTL